MYNIQKIADEIFKAPTEKELVKRIEFYSRNELIEFLKKLGINDSRFIIRTLPHGAYVVSDNKLSKNIFEKIEKAILDRLVKWWKFFTTTQELSDITHYSIKYEWSEGTLDDYKNVYKLERGFLEKIYI
jgi:hypothetical protein